MSFDLFQQIGFAYIQHRCFTLLIQAPELVRWNIRKDLLKYFRVIFRGFTPFSSVNSISDRILVIRTIAKMLTPQCQPEFLCKIPHSDLLSVDLTGGALF